MSWLGRLRRGDEGAAPALPGEGDPFLPAGEATIFRVVRTASAPEPVTGRRLFRSGIGVSFSSRDEADRIADQQARLAVERALVASKDALAGYAYLVNRKTEPLVETLQGPAGIAARVTVNGYGALVLNATRALFVDVDTVDEGERPAADPPRALTEALARRPELRFRTYRTRGGWRLLCTNEVFDPESPETATTLAGLGADEKYVLLCRFQRSFRARLTPKPWRARYRGREIAPGNSASRADVQRYIDRTWSYATARHIAGDPADIALELRPLVDYHDRWTQATSGKPLA